MSVPSLTLTDAAALIDELFTPTHLRDPIRPLLALEEGADAFEMHADLPRVRAEELEIWVSDGWLELAAEHLRRPAVPCCLLGGERRLSFSRRYPLSMPVAPERARAQLHGGRLHLHLPKRARSLGDAPARVRIEVAG